MNRNVKIVAVMVMLMLMFAFSGCGSNNGSTDTSEDKTDKDETTVEVDMDKVTINTQSSIKLEGSKTIYIDPFKRSEKTRDADIIFITHAHYDHFDKKSMKRAAGKETVIVCPKSMLNDIGALGISDKVTGMEPGEEQEIDGIKVEAVPAYNIDKSFHPKDNGWLGYVITLDGVRYYAAGDTDALDELADIECDVALVPIGGKYTMTAEEAAGLVNKICPKYAVPTHYGSIVGSASDADAFASRVDTEIKVVKKVKDTM